MVTSQQSSCALSIPMVSSPVVLYQSPWSLVSSPVVLYQSPWSAVQLCFINPHGQQSNCALSIPMVSSPVVLYQSPWSLVSSPVVLYQSPWSTVQLCFINPFWSLGQILKGLEQEVDDKEETGRSVSVLLPLCVWSAVECCDLWQFRFRCLFQVVLNCFVVRRCFSLFFSFCVIE